MKAYIIKILLSETLIPINIPIKKEDQGLVK